MDFPSELSSNIPPSQELKREQGSMEDFEHLMPVRSAADDTEDLLGIRPSPPATKKETTPDIKDVKTATLDFLSELTSEPKTDTTSKSPLDFDDFSFSKPLPPEPVNQSADFVKAESEEPKMNDFKSDIDLMTDALKFGELNGKDTGEKAPFSFDESPRDSPPPVPKHQSPPPPDDEDEFEPSQTPEPDFEPPQPEPVKFEPHSPKLVDLPAPKPLERPEEPKPEPPKPVETPKPSSPKPKPSSQAGGDIGAKDVFSKIGLDTWFHPGRLHPKVESLIYWRDVRKSGAVFGIAMVSLISLVYCSLISVVSYLCLVTLFATISFRIYKNIMQAIQKTSDGHPFKDLLEVEIEVSEGRVREVADTAVKQVNASLVELRRLFLVVDLVDSLKFAVCLWAMTYIGAWFNGLTLVIIGVVALFSLPKVYENNKQQIDTYVDLATGKVSEITNKVKAALPVGKKEAEKPKDQ